MLDIKIRQKRGTLVYQAPAMHRVWGNAGPQYVYVSNLTFHFYQSLFSRFEPVTSWLHGDNFLPSVTYEAWRGALTQR